MCETSTAPGTIAILRNYPPTHSVISPRPAFNSTGCFSPRRTVCDRALDRAPGKAPLPSKTLVLPVVPFHSGLAHPRMLGPVMLVVRSPPYQAGQGHSLLVVYEILRTSSRTCTEFS